MKKFILWILLCLFMSIPVFADDVIGAPLEFTQEDGSSATYPYSVKVNHTDNGDGTISITPATIDALALDCANDPLTAALDVWGQLSSYDATHAKYAAMYHDGTDGVVGTNSGALSLIPATDINAILGDAAGADKFYVKDSGVNTVASVDSDGNVYFAGNVGIGTNAPSAKLEVNGDIDWSAGNMIYVPLTGDIETYITNATAGDTLILSAGTYALTDSIDISKSINIIGQGLGKTTISYTATGNDEIFSITESNVTIRDCTLTYSQSTGTGNFYAVYANGATGTVLSNVNIIDCVISGTSTSGVVYGAYYNDAGGIIRDTTISVATTGTNKIGVGIWFVNNNTAEAVTSLYCYNVTSVGSGSGVSDNAAGFINQDNVSAQDSIMYLYSCFGYGTGSSAGEDGILINGSDALVYAENCVFQGDDNDIRIANSGFIQLRSCVLVNNIANGTPTYSGNLRTNTLLSNNGITVNEAGADSDTRFEGDNDANLLYIDAGMDRVGIGTNVPGTKLDVQGSVTLGSASTDTITCTGRLIVRTLASDPQDGTPGNRPAGSLKEIGYYNGKLYFCTNASTPTWELITSS